MGRKPTFISLLALITLGGILGLICLANEAIAHTVKTEGDVGVTFHIEPNHNPRVGEVAHAWFVLTHRGGEVIPLEACHCQLVVTSHSLQTQKKTVLTPELKSTDAEQYQGIPGANIIFPEAGIYHLEIRGTPKSGTRFEPFQLKYDVTVLPGKTVTPKPSNIVPQTPQSSASGLGTWGWIGGMTLLTILIFGAIRFQRNLEKS
jgi:hypothetical protein